MMPDYNISAVVFQECIGKTFYAGQSIVALSWVVKRGSISAPLLVSIIRLLPLHKHRHHNVDIVLTSDRPDYTGAGRAGHFKGDLFFFEHA